MFQRARLLVISRLHFVSSKWALCVVYGLIDRLQGVGGHLGGPRCRFMAGCSSSCHRCWGDGAGNGGCSRCKQPHLDGKEGCACASYVIVVVDKLKITKSS
jgi:hypothetical protein